MQITTGQGSVREAVEPRGYEHRMASQTACILIPALPPTSFRAQHLPEISEPRFSHL